MAQEESIIEVQNVSVGYDGFAVQKNLNFTVQAGEIFIIMGGSGCGKCTLLKHMIGLHKPLTGDIRLFGVNNPFPFYPPPIPHKLPQQGGMAHGGGAFAS